MKPLTIRTSFAWAFSEQTLQQLVQLAAAVIIARLLTPEEMGIFALAYAASAVLTALRSFGVGNYLIREPDLHREGPFRLRRHVADLLGSGTRAVSRPARHRGPLDRKSTRLNSSH